MPATLFLKIILMVGSWIFGIKAERARKAKEIAQLFKNTTLQGDNLGLQMFQELNQVPKRDWDEIELRDEEQSEGAEK